MGKVSQEEARREHLRSLHRRSRFRTRVAVQDESDNSLNNSLPYGREEQQVSGSSLPFPIDRTNVNFPPPSYHPDSTMHSIPHCRSFSTATYHQPIYPLQINASLCYPSMHQGVRPSVSQRLRSMEVRGIGELPETNDADDDDVFAPSGSRTLPPQHSGMQMPLPAVIPYSPTSLQLMQSRKRAHSAGDMVGFYSPSVNRILYANSNQVGVHAPNFLISNNERTPSFVNSIPTGATIPRKWMITDQSISQFEHPQPQQPVGFSNQPNVLMKKPTAHSALLRSMPTRPIHATVEKHLKHTAMHKNVAIPDSVNKLRKLTRKSHLPQASSSIRTEATPQSTSVLKSSLSSKSTSTKKKVNWNDLPRQKLKKGDETSRLNHCMKNIDIEMIRTNPSAFTEEHKIGPFLIGPKLGNCPVKTISQYLVRKSGTSKYYMAKVLQLNDEEVTSGKMLLHTENSLLSLLSSQSGVIKQHGLFKDCSFDAKTGKIIPRVGLVLDCLTPHEYDPQSLNFLNLQQYVIQMKRLNEHDAIRIFHSILTIVYSLHKSNVVHRDLKLGNMVLNKRTRKIILTNFCLGCHLTGDHDLLTDQRGSPAYISPDVLSDKPYAGKPSDMWSLGVILYTMLYGQFPFYDQEPKKLFAKIKSADYTIPDSGQVSFNTNFIIRNLLTLDPSARLTALGALKEVEKNASIWKSHHYSSSVPLQVVPDVIIDDKDEEQENSSDKAPIKSGIGKSEREMHRDFLLKMSSDDEDSTVNAFSKTSRRRRNYVNVSNSRFSQCRSSNDCIQVESVR